MSNPMKTERYLDLPLGTRIQYPGHPERTYVILEQRSHHGCGVVAEWRDDMPRRWIGQGIYSYSNSRDEHDTAMAVVVEDALRLQLTAAEKPLVMADGSSFADYLRNAVPEDAPMDEWTKGYETCKRRLAAILLPQLEDLK